ncbi:olfactory receptor 10A4-like [Pezoporus wallicus]|uniref:olfactory receptor 10A4-like n=1 Tax=Pezoporus wallicus TaxID=35540 RepID=UPI00254CD503|nr:olfactory receptor 10A4-like [Pezoporus wallicus]XP_061333604.1 olfactory receptor 10A4-like [Pezoporus flaviventris]
MTSAVKKSLRDITSRNHTVVTYFQFLPFSSIPEIQGFLFCLVLFMYISTLVGNILIITITMVDAALHSPMYFFLKNLSFLEIGYTTSIIPKMLVNLLIKRKGISFLGCATQMYAFSLFGITECCLLAAMAYDRYLAICHPLHYMTMMSWSTSFLLSAVSWLVGVLVALWQTTLIFTLPYCGPKRINHFFCDLPPLLKLACGATYKNEITIYIVAVVFIMVPFLFIVASYVQILHTIFKMPTAKGKRKTFSTCFSHLVVVTLFYGSGIVTYLRPKAFYSSSSNKLLSLSYTLMSPVMNPLIYSLRNKEVKQALKRLIAKKISM